MLLITLQNVFDRLQWFAIVVWALVPPLALLLIYYRRVRAAPPLTGAVALFGMGMLAGLVAWSLVNLFDQLILLLPSALSLDRTASDQKLLHQVLWQTTVVALSAEVCKLLAVLLPLRWLMRKYQRLPAQPSTVLLATVAVALGFAAQMNLVALWYGHASVMPILLVLPMQAIFSMSWGFALGFALSRMPLHVEYSFKLTLHGWLAACLCHGAWNGLMALSRAPGQFMLLPASIRVTPHDLLYLLFPWGLWLWWQTEHMLARSQGEVMPRLVNGRKPIVIASQYFGSVCCLVLGGAALNALRDFGHSLNVTWQLRMTLNQSVAAMLGRDLLEMTIFGTIALWVFWHLRRRAHQAE